MSDQLPGRSTRHTPVLWIVAQLRIAIEPDLARSEAKRLASDFQGNPEAEYQLFYNLGVDGVFSEFADHAKAARDR